MNDHEVIAILVGVLALLAGGLGYGLGEQRRHRDETTQNTHFLEGQIEEHERRLRAHGALIDVIAEDYDPPATDAPKRRTKLPEGWAVYKGGGALALLAVLGAWLRRHWRGVTTGITAAGAASVIAVAVLAHGAPPAQRRLTAPPPSPPHTGATTSPSAAPSPAPPTTKPGRTPHPTLPPSPLVPVRRRTPPPIPNQPTTAAPPQPSPRPSTSRGPAPPRPSPTRKCPIGVTVYLPGIGVTICV